MKIYILFSFSILSSCVTKTPAEMKTSQALKASLTELNANSDSEKKTQACSSAEDFQKIYEFLKAEKDLDLTDARSLKISFEVLNGCTGASERFIKVYSLLKKSGVSLKESFKAGLDFAKLTDQRTENFITIFKDSFLNEFLDFSFDASYRLAYQLSKDLPQGVNRVRTDFHNFVSFCLDSKKMGLSLPVCAKYTLQFVDLTQAHQEELFPDFTKLYEFFTDGKGLKLTVVEALPFCFRILQYGPNAAENFFETLKYTQKNMNLSLRQSLELSLIVSQKTRVHDESIFETLKPNEKMLKQNEQTSYESTSKKQ